MTVCIAALCVEGIILGAADRMLTAYDVEFEPPRRKIFDITSSIRIMTSGDSALQSEIIQGLKDVVYLLVKKAPDNWLNIKEVANIYVESYNSIKRGRSEAAILSPLGLTHDTFVAKQQQMTDGFITTITERVINFAFPTVSAIITGIDDTGAHIYVVRNHEIACFDTVGFASIGIGSRHAKSLFMFSRHTPSADIDETLSLIYSAKKRAEVAPGVGKDTDMFIVGPQLGSAYSFLPEILDDLDEIYKKYAAQELVIQEKAREEVTKYVDKLVEKAIQRTQVEDSETESLGE